VAKFRSLMNDKKFLEVDGRILAVECGDVVDLPDTWLSGRYMQVGEYGEEPQWEALVETPKEDKAAKAESETKEK